MDVIIIIIIGIPLLYISSLLFAEIKKFRQIGVWLKKFEHNQWEVRESVLYEVNSFLSKHTNPRLINLLIKALHDQDWHIRRTAALIFEQKIDSRVRSGRTTVSVVHTMLKPSAIKALVHVMHDERVEVRQYATGALSNIHNQEVLVPLLEALHDEDSRVRRKAIHGLGNILAFPAIPQLLEFLQGPEHTSAEFALKQLCPNVRKIVFGSSGDRLSDEDYLIYNPNLSYLTTPMSMLREIEIRPSSCNSSLLESFTQYASLHLEKNQIKNEIRLSIYGALDGLPAEFFQVFQDCQHVNINIVTVTFGNIEETLGILPPVWHNPDATHVTLPLKTLRHIIVDTASYDFHHLERFLTYAINYIGQDYLRKEVEVHIHGDPDQLPDNIRNNFTNLCKDVISST